MNEPGQIDMMSEADVRSSLQDLVEQNVVLQSENGKLRTLLIEHITMCRVAAKEISDHWEAHCDEEGYGPINLLLRLRGEIAPDIYPAYEEEARNALKP